MGIDNVDWHRKSLQQQNQNLRGTNQSSGRTAIGSRGISKGVQSGGLSGGGIGIDAINTDQIGRIQTSTHLNTQHSILPLVSDCTIVVTTTNASNNADIQVYGSGGIGTNVSIYRPDSSILLAPPILTTTQVHNFGGLGVNVYVSVTYNVFFDVNGNGRFTAYWKSSPFIASEIALIFGDNNVPVLQLPSKQATGLITGTAGSYTIHLSGQGF